jgi:hypothetical protein
LCDDMASLLKDRFIGGQRINIPVRQFDL